MRRQTRKIDVPSGPRLVRQIRNVIAFSGLAGLAVFTFVSRDVEDHVRVGLISLVFLLCGWTVYRLVVQYVHGERLRQVKLSDAARMEGATLATRTVRHHLGNRLAVAVGYSELLAEDPRLPHDLEQHAQRIMASALAAVETVDKLHEGIVRVQLDSRVAGPPLLDVDASTSGNPPPMLLKK